MGAAVASFNKATTAAGNISANVLAAPTSVTDAGTGPITLNWTATASTFATGTRVLRGTTAGGPYSQIAQVTPRTTTTYVDTPPGPGTYYYVVQAYYQQWTSANSNEASGARIPITLIQKATGGNTSLTFTATFPATPTAGNLLVAVAGTRLAGTMTTPAGWSVAINETGGGVAVPNQAIYYKIAGAVEPTLVTIVTTATGAGNGLQIYEYRGATSLLGTSSATATTGTALTTGSVVVSPTYSLQVAGLADQAGTGVSTWTNGFTEESDFTAGAGGARTVFAGADAVKTVAGTFSSGATATNSGNWRGQIAAFN
jgi:hypothetical protein